MTMTASEFRLFCERIKKPDKQLGQLLGLSEQAIREYESGKAPIPGDVERKLFFLISRLRSEEVIRRPCWKVKNCPVEKRMNCPAWEYQSGAICWLIDGTICEENPGETLEEKWERCKQCEVIDLIATPSKRHPVRKEEVDYQTNVVSQFEQIVGKDPKMQVVYRLIQDVAVTNTTVMIQGESGTGKELVARAIHRLSSRHDKPFIVINCSAFPETLLESELFGHEKGAFTGADKTRAGRFEQADGGTVFLDEIGDISPQAQVKLLRVLQTQKLKRLGGDQILSVDIRVITASNKNLKDQVKEKKFRADLFYRLNVIPMYLPALRNKRNDIPLLANHFLERLALEFGKDIHDFAPGAMRQLLDYDWPGNTRELEHCLEYAVVLAKGNRIEVKDLPFALDESHSLNEDGSNNDSLAENEKQHIRQIMESSCWNKKEAAERLGISRSTLYEKIKRYHLSENKEEYES
ncbi:sigma-54 dependent transcriptional regulator [bacterium]|nr:sigma-54 dependent transcriptional regulator [bacterium]